MAEQTNAINSKNIISKSKSLKKGIVVSDKMDKTIVVEVDILKQHPKYKKRYVSSGRYKVHDENNQFVNGDKVTFQPCRPISKDKKWTVVVDD